MSCCVVPAGKDTKEIQGGKIWVGRSFFCHSERSEESQSCPTVPMGPWFVPMASKTGLKRSHGSKGRTYGAVMPGSRMPYALRAGTRLRRYPSHAQRFAQLWAPPVHEDTGVYAARRAQGTPASAILQPLPLPLCGGAQASRPVPSAPCPGRPCPQSASRLCHFERRPLLSFRAEAQLKSRNLRPIAHCLAASTL